MSRGGAAASASNGSNRVDLRLPPLPGAVSEARRALGGLELPEPVLEDARLLVTELVTNSIRHARLGPGDVIRVRATWSGARLRVEVTDRPNIAQAGDVAGAIRPRPGAQSGWGLYLVERLSSRWGRMPGTYWFELDTSGEVPRTAAS